MATITRNLIQLSLSSQTKNHLKAFLIDLRVVKMEEHIVTKPTLDYFLRYKGCKTLMTILLGILRPMREFFSHIKTSPLPV